MRGTVEAVNAERVGGELAKLREAVAVVVILLTVAVALVESHAVGVVVADKRHVSAHDIFKRLTADEQQRVVQTERVALRVLRDDIDGAADSIGAEECRAAAANHLYPIYHRRRNLFEAIDTSKRTDNGAAVDENLRVGTLKTIDADLRETAVLAVVLDTKSGLERERLCKVGSVELVEKRRVEHIHHHWGVFPLHDTLVGRDDNLVEIYCTVRRVVVILIRNGRGIRICHNACHEG